jgi:hypothetical protein
VSLCPPQIPHDQNPARNRTAAVGSRRLTIWVTARPLFKVTCGCFSSVIPSLWKVPSYYISYLSNCTVCPVIHR